MLQVQSDESDPQGDQGGGNLRLGGGTDEGRPKGDRNDHGGGGAQD